ncbi:MAG: LacI family transcriptional regulator [Spirochaetes bacterium]|nr:LacI family transcriptional regulator [Spirochaetota bacterium]
MAVTIKDVAEYAKVSVSTVSMALNGKDYRISQATVEKVKYAVKHLNYRPNRTAVSLVTKKSQAVGLIVPDITNSFFSELVAAVEAKCAKEGYSVIICNTNEEPSQDVRYVNFLLDQNVDGVLFVMSVNEKNICAEECLKLLQEARVPTILLDREWQSDYAVSVVSDNELGGYLACSHLLDLGHRKIGCISGPMGTQSARRRFDGYIRALKERGIDFDPAITAEGDYHTQSGYSLCDKLLERGISAMFVCNDMMTLGVYKRLRERGLKIPQDISIVGFDNLNFTEFLDVPLTTIYQPVREMGAAAALKLLNMLQYGSKGFGQMFTPELIRRDSSAKPKEGL